MEINVINCQISACTRRDKDTRIKDITFDDNTE